jgi:hypothetical protein
VDNRAFTRVNDERRKALCRTIKSEKHVIDWVLLTGSGRNAFPALAGKALSESYLS